MSTSVSATITQSVSMSGASFSNSTVEVTGETAAVVEATLAASETNTIAGIAFDKDNCGLLYLLSDTTDCTVTFTTSGSPVSIALTAGVPYLLYSSTEIAALLVADVTGMSVHNDDETAGVANAVETDFHARLIYSA